MVSNQSSRVGAVCASHLLVMVPFTWDNDIISMRNCWPTQNMTKNCFCPRNFHLLLCRHWWGKKFSQYFCLLCIECTEKLLHRYQWFKLCKWICCGKKFEEKKTMLPNSLWPFLCINLNDRLMRFISCAFKFSLGSVVTKRQWWRCNSQHNNTNTFLNKKGSHPEGGVGPLQRRLRFLECAAGCVTSVTSTKSGVTLICPQSLNVNTHRPISSSTLCCCGSQPCDCSPAGTPSQWWQTNVLN